VPKVQHKPIKVQERVQIKGAKDNPKAALVWRTGLSGAPPDSVQCTREFHSKLATFGNSGGRSAIIHRTVRCTKRSNESKRQRSSATATVNRNSADCVRRVRASVRRCTDSEQDLSGPTVRTQRTGDVAGAPDSVRWRTGLSGASYDRSPHQRFFWWLGL
jgi:hypothetical protein